MSVTGSWDTDFYLKNVLGIKQMAMLCRICETYHHIFGDLVESYKILMNDKVEEPLFVKACKLGLLKLAKWMYNRYSIDIHADVEAAFRWCCNNGHLDVAKWLVELGKSTGNQIDIHVCNEYVFSWCCYYGHLEVAKWLISMEPKYWITIAFP